MCSLYSQFPAADTAFYHQMLVNGTTPCAVALALTEPRYIVTQSIIDMMKAVKNDVEIEGLRHAYLRDGACFVRFFAWLEEMIGEGETVGPEPYFQETSS